MGFPFDLQLFGSAPSAQRITLGIGKESTYGTAVSPTVFLIPSSEQLDGTNDLIARPGARGIVGQAEQLTGLFMGKGNFSVEVDCDTIGAILLATMGAESIAANTANPSPATVTTTIADANGVPAGFGPCTPAAMTNITKGQSLTIGADTVLVRAVSATQFWAYFPTAHATGVAITNAAVVLAQDHTFTLASPRLSFTAQANDITSAKNSFGCKMSQLSMKLTPKQVLEAQCQVEYQGEAKVASPTSPTYSTLHGLVFTTPGNAVTYNGIAVDSAVQGISFDINTGLITDYPKLGQGRYRGNLPETQTKAKVSMDVAFETETLLEQFWGNTGATGPQGDVLPGPLVVTLQAIDMVNTAVPYQLVITVPMAKISTAPVTRKVGDYLKQTIQFECSESTSGAGDDIKFVLTNASSSASL